MLHDMISIVKTFEVIIASWDYQPTIFTYFIVLYSNCNLIGYLTVICKFLL